MWPTHYIPSQERIEGVPPPTFYLTTPPYPAEITESLFSSGVPQDLGFVPFAEAEDYITCAGRPVGGSISSDLIGFDGGEEYIQSAGLPIGGVLNQILVTTSVEPEFITAAGIPLSGTLRDPLVVYDNWPLGFETEDLQSAGIPVSGALT
jgi:hypothetical protein